MQTEQQDKKTRLLWERRHHQDNLIHTRVGWTITTQAFLLIGLANFIEKESELGQELASIIPWVGFVSTGIMMISIITGVETYHKIRKEIEKQKSDISPTIERSGIAITLLGFLPTFVMPSVFVVLWFLVILNR